jgi:hypothetical protein
VNPGRYCATGDREGQQQCIRALYYPEHAHQKSTQSQCEHCPAFGWRLESYIRRKQNQDHGQEALPNAWIMHR